MRIWFVPAFDLQCTCFRPVMYLLGTSWVFTFVMVLCDLMAHGLSQKHNVIYRQICGVVRHVGGTFIRQYQRIFYFVVGISNESIKRAMGRIVFARFHLNGQYREAVIIIDQEIHFAFLFVVIIEKRMPMGL